MDVNNLADNNRKQDHNYSDIFGKPAAHKQNN
jgi:hypothetical protein